jgi:hypothetical protein
LNDTAFSSLPEYIYIYSLRQENYFYWFWKANDGRGLLGEIPVWGNGLYKDDLAFNLYPCRNRIALIPALSRGDGLLFFYIKNWCLGVKLNKKCKIFSLCQPELT